MDFEFWFFMLIAFATGRLSMLRFYFGYDAEKYCNADIGVLLHR